jgi:3-oxoacyl-[acyl-carrier protein] reductase
MKKYIVTGAAQGIGFQVVKDLLALGNYVLLNDVDASELNAASEALNQQGYLHFSTICSDAASESFLDELDLQISQTPGQLTGVVCNAGITTFGDFWTYQRSSMDRILEVNIKGTFFLIQKVASLIRASNQSGSIVLTSSVTGHIAHPDLAAYGMTKAALNQLARNLVIDLSPFQIRINSVSPGATLTERTLSDVDYQQQWSHITPMGKPATVQDISDAILFFLSDQSKHITGQALVVDGGWTSVGIPPKS